ncbi:CvpA family protein [bacterium]|nr:CvpA family protein [bacterium]
MIVDTASALLIILAMAAGYFSGGFKTILRLVIFTIVFLALRLPSIASAMQDFAGPRFYSSLFVFVLVVSTLILNLLLSFALKGLLNEKKSGLVGTTNRSLGLIIGFCRGILVLFVLFYILDALISHEMLVEEKSYLDESIAFTMTRAFIDSAGMKFF